MIVPNLRESSDIKTNNKLDPQSEICPLALRHKAIVIYSGIEIP